MKSKIIKNMSDCNIEKLGFKIACYACHGSFYDLGNADPICPYCQSLYSKTIKKRKSNEIQENLPVIEEDTEEDTIIDDDE